MKRTRSICLLFILAAILIVVCFWFGFLFGKESQYQKDMVAITEANLEIAALTQQSSQLSKTVEEQKAELKLSQDKIALQENHTLPASSEHAQPQFYLKEAQEYVCVFVAATDELYFETDILVSELPFELQEDMQIGLEFYDLESVYTFLENYSS